MQWVNKPHAGASAYFSAFSHPKGYPTNNTYGVLKRLVTGLTQRKLRLNFTEFSDGNTSHCPPPPTSPKEGDSADEGKDYTIN